MPSCSCHSQFAVFRKYFLPSRETNHHLLSKLRVTGVEKVTKNGQNLISSPEFSCYSIKHIFNAGLQSWTLSPTLRSDHLRWKNKHILPLPKMLEVITNWNFSGVILVQAYKNGTGQPLRIWSQTSCCITENLKFLNCIKHKDMCMLSSFSRVQLKPHGL